MERITLFDGLLRELRATLPARPDKTALFNPALTAPEGDKNAILFRDETAYELGGSGKSAVSCVVFGEIPAARDSVLLYGPDLSEIAADAPFAHITAITLGESDGPLTAEKLKEIGFRVFQLYPAGFHIRISPASGREQARVAKRALAQTPPLSLLNVGCSLIALLKEHPAVEAASTVFVTAPDADYAALSALGRKARQITNAVESALDTNELDCASCKMKPICDEVEGLRALHFGQQKERTEKP